MPTLQMTEWGQNALQGMGRERERVAGGWGVGETTDNVFYYDGHFFLAL